ncbi:NAD-dependent epimerase/dehydratase family protein [Aspergillus fijiensis CBS 313.89]|uniref:NAD dependent epimerase/dehydratase family protein n=1 Tax=Aspergillus fijiensis CBS 313.89 TaxID=1448319 RepID=A0A8G1VTE6_9EURO|nr:NAD dependent epimerase/dehydratase family protein [Aspergillus fijiensis CBS 313.89]RAK72240.1 NAD dependent epimerase/dehydratase family protein [Aspergillus fijiensis CBS 313.89]
MTRSILITGVSGYIGGAIVAEVLEAQQNNDLSGWRIAGLVRSEAQAAKIRSLSPVEPIVVSDFDELDKLEEIAQGFDVIIHAGAGWHTASARAFLRGLAIGKRNRAGHRHPHYIQISGTSNLSDRPHSANFIEDHIFSDAEDDIFAYEKAREAREVYYQRTTDIAVVELGEELGIPTHIVMAPTIFGLSKGLFNRFSVQLPAIIADAVTTGQVKVLGDGQTVWTHVHIDDLARFFVVLLQHIADEDVSREIPSGRRGIYFCESGQHTHHEFSQRLADAGVELGIFKSAELASVSVQEAADAWAGGNAARVELSFGANARCKAVLARQLGWIPKHEKKWAETFHIELQEYVERPPDPKTLPLVMQKKKTST